MPSRASTEVQRREQEGWEKGHSDHSFRGIRQHCKNPVPMAGGVRGITRSDFLLLKLQRFLFPSAFAPSAEATARERRFARVALGPKQMERTCCKHFTRHGPDSCSMPPSPADSSLDHPMHRVPR